MGDHKYSRLWLSLWNYSDEAFPFASSGLGNTHYSDKALAITSPRLEKTMKIDAGERQRT
jgi:hypothetical protein